MIEVENRVIARAIKDCNKEIEILREIAKKSKTRFNLSSYLNQFNTEFRKIFRHSYSPPKTTRKTIFKGYDPSVIKITKRGEKAYYLIKELSKDNALSISISEFVRITSITNYRAYILTMEGFNLFDVTYTEAGRFRILNITFSNKNIKDCINRSIILKKKALTKDKKLIALFEALKKTKNFSYSEIMKYINVEGFKKEAIFFRMKSLERLGAIKVKRLDHFKKEIYIENQNFFLD
jgi:hypothetical protein